MASRPILAADLALTRYVGTASAAPLPSADSWGGLDLRVVGRGSLDDLSTVDDRANLGQALTLRLLTLKGVLAPLGHPDYGCRLVSLIGRLNNETTRNLARLYVIEAVKAEPRVAGLTALRVDPAPGQPDRILIDLTVKPLGDGDPLSLALEFAL